MANWQCYACLPATHQIRRKAKERRGSSTGRPGAPVPDHHTKRTSHACMNTQVLEKSICLSIALLHCIIYFVCVSVTLAWLSIPVRSRDGSAEKKADRHDSDARSQWPPLPIRRRKICVAFDEHARTDRVEERSIHLRAALWHHAHASSIVVLPVVTTH